MPNKNSNAESDLIRLRDDLDNSLKSISMHSHTIHAPEFLSIVSDLITPTLDLSPNVPQWNEYDSLSSQLTNPEWSMHIEPNGITFFSEIDTVDVRGTPTFFLNGKKTNARDFNSLKSEIDQILAAK